MQALSIQENELFSETVRMTSVFLTSQKKEIFYHQDVAPREG